MGLARFDNAPNEIGDYRKIQGNDYGYSHPLTLSYVVTPFKADSGGRLTHNPVLFDRLAPWAFVWLGLPVVQRLVHSDHSMQIRAASFCGLCQNEYSGLPVRF